MAEVSDWERQLERCKVTAGAMAGRKQVHYTFPDDTEMVEEYDLSKDNLLIRRWKRKSTLGKESDWEYELGEDYAPSSKTRSSSMIAISSSNPVCVRHDTEKAFCWRIRNIPYPIDTYKLSVEDNKIVLRTTNKKYFRRIDIPDMRRLKLPLKEDALKCSHAGTTLLIEYAKPEQMLAMEKRLRDKRRKIKVNKDGDVDCKVS